MRSWECCPGSWQKPSAAWSPGGPGILLTVILLDVFANTRILIRIIGPAVNTLSDLMVGHNVF